MGRGREGGRKKTVSIAQEKLCQQKSYLFKNIFNLPEQLFVEAKKPRFQHERKFGLPISMFDLPISSGEIHILLLHSCSESKKYITSVAGLRVGSEAR